MNDRKKWQSVLTKYILFFVCTVKTSENQLGPADHTPLENLMDGSKYPDQKIDVWLGHHKLETQPEDA